MTVLRFPLHNLVSHDRYEDLAGCTICGAWEGELPYFCPGEPMTEEQKGLVLDGKLDYYWKEGWTQFTRNQRMRIRYNLFKDD